jgi:hypothetical protein
MAYTDDINMIRLDGFDDAVIGIAYQIGQPEALVYSEEKIIEILMKDSEMEREEAIEYYEFNIKGGYFGHGNPIFMAQLEEWEREELLPAYVEEEEPTS